MSSGDGFEEHAFQQPLGFPNANSSTPRKKADDGMTGTPIDHGEWAKIYVDLLACQDRFASQGVRVKGGADFQRQPEPEPEHTSDLNVAVAWVMSVARTNVPAGVIGDGPS